jgi:two-component system, NtrC family, nitrogen regulation sensor histidine kinase NtrY
MGSLRGRLIAVFLAATLLPLGGMVWLNQALIEESLAFNRSPELERLSRQLEQTGRDLYQTLRDRLREDALAHRAKPVEPAPGAAAAFLESGDAERFERASGVLRYWRREGDRALLFERGLGAIDLDRPIEELRQARRALDTARPLDLRRGFFYTGLLVAGAIWLVSMVVLVVIAGRFTRPITQLTNALATLGSGDLSVRISDDGRADEAGAAIEAFNRMAAQLEQSRQRLIYLAQVASWQQLARKMAHEVKNSLTPIRLNVEEIVARARQGDQRVLEQASQIIIEEIGVLERRIRAFSELGAEPPVNRVSLDINAAVQERVVFLRQARPETVYQTDLAPSPLEAFADADLARGILTNLLENAAQAAGAGGVVQLITRREGPQVRIDVLDSGPGLSAEARASLFEPTISFKKGGMGIGLSIARKNALSCGGDIVAVPSPLGGAGFRVLLPAAV